MDDLDSLVLDGWGVSFTFDSSYQDHPPYVVALRRYSPLKTVLGAGHSIEEALTNAARTAASRA